MQFIMDSAQRTVILQTRDSVLRFYDRSVLHKEVAIARADYGLFAFPLFSDPDLRKVRKDLIPNNAETLQGRGSGRKTDFLPDSFYTDLKSPFQSEFLTDRILKEFLYDDRKDLTHYLSTFPIADANFKLQTSTRTTWSDNFRK